MCTSAFLFIHTATQTVFVLICAFLFFSYPISSHFQRNSTDSVVKETTVLCPFVAGFTTSYSRRNTAIQVGNIWWTIYLETYQNTTRNLERSASRWHFMTRSTWWPSVHHSWNVSISYGDTAVTWPSLTRMEEWTGATLECSCCLHTHQLGASRWVCSSPRPSLFLLLTHSPVGGLPLGVFVTTSESEAAVKCGMDLLKDILPGEAFFGRGAQRPKVIMTDDSRANGHPCSLAVMHLAALHLPCAAGSMEVASGW